ncbi:hypothetical protein PR202_gb27690 [Eleusine coracana subsp. coracana]|uniref:Protein kinase domain-containing protein n=1 Tax=Eleusine coracana subsp. coracana TaxID=191504 RepID=A0AAV5FV82_ELECO|nr:hypothetical protein QOZ80_6AG0542820 [Eleusine coracana subsp. coracana]GJN38630.1 hypothetical protein PR202_gb27690 [Eleusine coracana subsp. coracana]
MSWPGTCNLSLSPLLHVLVLLLLIAGEGIAQPATGDRNTLLVIKKDWGSPPQLTSWDATTDADADHCRWKGVTCAGAGSGVVTELSLPFLNLTGSVPASVCTLKNLTHLDLSYNNLAGAFPAATLFACTHLRTLNLSNNLFSGPLPADIDGLSPAMEHLNLSSNRFAGEVPPAVARLPALKSLLLDTNRFTGAYPAAEIGRLAGLDVLTLANNMFAPAPVPTEFAKLTKLTYLWMFNMSLTGEIPEAFSNLTELRTMDLSWNNLTGTIPAWVLQHRKLEQVYLYYNVLSGELPRNVTAVNLIELDVSSNQLTGKIPESFGNLKNLSLMYLYQNQFTGTIPASIVLLPMLSDIKIFDNQLSGELPPELGKHSPLSNLEMDDNLLSGPLPETLCANGFLYGLVAFNNSFSGVIPASLGNCVTLKNLMLQDNNFSDEFPAKIWSLPRLTRVRIQNNKFTGALPAQISSNITRIEMGNNMFSGSIPTSATGLQAFHAESNRLGGELPSDMSKLANLTYFSVPGNRITGSIPTSIKLLQKLTSLNLSGNHLSGAIPPGSVGLLPTLTTLDLSNNELTGTIPSDISSMVNPLNLSSNQLTGEVPMALQSAAYGRSFLGNQLCARANSGTNLPPCPGGGQGAHVKLSTGFIILFAMLASVVLVSCICIICLLFRRRKDNDNVIDWKMTVFNQLNFTELDVLNNIREENVIGSGGSGKVYRIRVGSSAHNVEGCRMVAVKRIWNSRKLDAKLDKEFESEVKVLGNIRHNNIVKLLCCISSQEAKLLVYEYMENGSLDRWLHHRDRDGAPVPLDWPTRLAIAIDAVRGLSYMHHECVQPIVHRDIKSSNILLDPDFQAKIADFGLARILVKQSSEPESVSAIGGTFGYMAPEYGHRRKVNEKVDVYSFGVVLLELTTGRVANDSNADLCLAEWAWQRYQKGVPFNDVVDEAIREPALMQDILSVFTLGVICTGENPVTRPSMKEVLHYLIRCDQMSGDAGLCQMECNGDLEANKNIS